MGAWPEPVQWACAALSLAGTAALAAYVAAWLLKR